MIVGHIAGLPIEESVLQLAPAGAAVVSGFIVVAGKHLARLRRRFRRLEKGGEAGS